MSDQQEAAVEISNDSRGRDSQDTSSVSDDNDAGEQPVRRKLRDTTLENVPSTTINEDESGINDRGRLSRKRSLDDLRTEDNDMAGATTDESKDGTQHRRKRSRDSQTNGSEASRVPRDITPETSSSVAADQHRLLSPKKKRSIDQLHDGEQKPDHPGNGSEGCSEEIKDGEPEKKRHRDSSQEREAQKEGDAKPSLPSAFANVSAVSPFASLGTSNPPSESATRGASASTTATSPSAFASSGLAAFAGSEASPFGTLGSSTTSVFKSSATPATENRPTTSFASSSSTSPFVNTGSSGFASLGSGFSGSAFGSGFSSAGGKLTSFAAPNASTLGSSGLGSSGRPRPLDTSRDSSEEEEVDDSGEPSDDFQKEKEDERFFAQEIETGEEDEKTYLACKGKLFYFEGEWKERGVGTFKINVREPKNLDVDKLSARMIMRADGVLRVMLNSPIFKGMICCDPNGGQPKSKKVLLAGMEDGHAIKLLLRTGNEESAKEIYRTLEELKEQL